MNQCLIILKKVSLTLSIILINLIYLVTKNDQQIKRLNLESKEDSKLEK